MPRATKSLSTKAATSSIKQPSKEKRTRRRRVYPGCLRCRFLGTGCAESSSCCDACTAAGVDCLRLPVTDNDILFDTIPQSVQRQFTRTVPRRALTKAWKRSSAGAEFLSNDVDERLCTPECVEDLVENPVRLRLTPELTSSVLGKPLAVALEAFPEQDGERMPLPSSELLSCISNTFARAAATDTQEPISEHMGGGSLLAFGVLLQEYSRHLMYKT